MKTNNSIEDFIKKNRESFDNQMPLEGHFGRFKDKIENKPNKTANQDNWKYIAIAASLGFVIMSMISAYFYSNNQVNIARVEGEVLKMKETMILSLIENKSPSKRLKAVNYIDDYNSPVDEVIEALIKTLHHDENSNVRLAAAEGLIRFSNLKVVRKAFSDALIFEKDPSVQIELIHILVGIKETSGLEPMKKILNNKDIPEFLKEQAEEGIEELMIKL